MTRFNLIIAAISVALYSDNLPQPPTLKLSIRLSATTLPTTTKTVTTTVKMTTTPSLQPSTTPSQPDCRMTVYEHTGHDMEDLNGRDYVLVTCVPPKNGDGMCWHVQWSLSARSRWYMLITLESSCKKVSGSTKIQIM